MLTPTELRAASWDRLIDEALRLHAQLATCWRRSRTTAWPRDPGDLGEDWQLAQRAAGAVKRLRERYDLLAEEAEGK